MQHSQEREGGRVAPCAVQKSPTGSRVGLGTVAPVGVGPVHLNQLWQQGGGVGLRGGEVRIVKRPRVVQPWPHGSEMGCKHSAHPPSAAVRAACWPWRRWGRCTWCPPGTHTAQGEEWGGEGVMNACREQAAAVRTPQSAPIGVPTLSAFSRPRALNLYPHTRG